MAQWQILKSGEPTNGPLFDDGNQGQPGDETFSADAVKAHVVSLGAQADGFNYVGPSPAL